MTASRRPIFRDKAMQRYAQSMEKDVLPRTATPPVFIFLWILLGLLIAATIIAWLGQIPVFVACSGIIQTEQGSNRAAVVIFLSTNYLSKVQAGQPVQLPIASTGQQINDAIDKIEPGIVSLAQARQQYKLGNAGSQIVSSPSVVVTVRLNPSISMNIYEGSIIYAQTQVGS